MGAAIFYHLTRQPLEAVLPVLLGRARDAGWRVVVRGTSKDRIEWLDEKLWLGPEDGFLPHGVDGGEFDADQPILLTTKRGAENGAQCLMSIDGADVLADEIEKLERVCILFDGNDPTSLDHARGQWKTLSEAGCKAQYWSQDSGKWEMKAEAKADK